MSDKYLDRSMNGIIQSFYDASDAPRVISKIDQKFFISTKAVGTYSLYDKKELGVDRRVPGNAIRKTDFGRFGYHPRCTLYSIKFKRNIKNYIPLAFEDVIIGCGLAGY